MFPKYKITIGEFFHIVCDRIPHGQEGLGLVLSLEKIPRGDFEVVNTSRHQVGVLPTDRCRVGFLEALNGEGVDVFVQLKILRQFKRAQMKCAFDVDLFSRLQPFDRLGYVRQLGIVQLGMAEFFLQFQKIVCLQLINIPIHESFKLGRSTCTHR